MSESEIAELCRRIYRKHKRALDLIYEHRPDLQAQVGEVVEELIVEANDLILDHATKLRIGFVPAGWDTPGLRKAEGWTDSRRILQLQFTNWSEGLNLNLVFGPGDDELRQQLWERAKTTPPLDDISRSIETRYPRIWRREFLQSRDVEDATIDDLELKIRHTWKTFLAHDLPAIEQALQIDGEWIWEQHD